MRIIQSFNGTVNRGFQGNVIYRFQLPSSCRALSIRLTYTKEYPAKETDPGQFRSAYEAYIGRPVSEKELLKAVESMRTEIQLALLIGNKFAGNVHMPGTIKELYISEHTSSRGCLPIYPMEGTAKVIVNVFQCVENETSYQLEIKGDYEDVEKN
nr:DUF6669 family protein [uncultured Clostridium sp.]